MHIQKVLYVDSDKVYAQRCIQSLIDYGYDVKYASSMKEALVECIHIAPTIIIFDHELEDGDGFTLLKKIKGLGIECKSILLSKTFSKEMMLEALQLKIDSYIEKDENFSTLYSQITTLSERIYESQKKTEEGMFDLGNDFLYEKDSHHILHDSDTIYLTVQEKKLLDQLIKAAGDFISSEQLQYSIGKEEPVSIDTIRTVVRKIRRKTYHDLIINKNGHGYRINLQEKHNNDTLTKRHSNHISVDKTILIVKGNKQKNDQLNFYLEKLGIVNETVHTLEEANEILGYSSFDYIVTDIDLPDGEGIELLDNWKDKIDAKFIILANSSEVHYREFLYHKGIVDYITENDSMKHVAEDIYDTIVELETVLKESRVLVIENSKKIFEQIKTMLSPRNYHLHYINSCTNAIEMIQADDYDLVMIDKEIKNSLELITYIKEHINDTLPIVVLGDPTKASEQTRASFRRGADDCICKPIIAENFIFKIDYLIEQSKTIKSLKKQKDTFESYKSMLNETSIISKTDPDGVITYVNDLFCKLSGYSKEELIGQSHNILRHPETPEATYEELWETIKDKKEIWEGIVKNKRKDGNEYTLKTYIMPKTNKSGDIKEFIAFRQKLENKKDQAS